MEHKKWQNWTQSSEIIEDKPGSFFIPMICRNLIWLKSSIEKCILYKGFSTLMDLIFRRRVVVSRSWYCCVVVVLQPNQLFFRDEGFIWVCKCSLGINYLGSLIGFLIWVPYLGSLCWFLIQFPYSGYSSGLLIWVSFMGYSFVNLIQGTYLVLYLFLVVLETERVFSLVSHDYQGLC